MSDLVTIHLPEPAATELRQIAHHEHRSVSEIGARLIDEGLRQHRFPWIEFRSFNGERHACIQGALQVWQLVMVAKDYKHDIDKIAHHLMLNPEQVQAGLRYYEHYPEEIEQAIEENDLGHDQLQKMFPSLQWATMPLEMRTE